jgi:hypothetical protein
MRYLQLLLGGLAVCAVAASASLSPARATEVLITQAEANLPAQKGAVGIATRGITRGPKIEYIGDAAATPSPIRLRVKFESFGGTTIDTSSLKVTYLKTPAVDLTDRVKPFIQPTGIDMPDAVLPAGEHPLRIDVRDSDGRIATSSFVLKVVAP